MTQTEQQWYYLNKQREVIGPLPYAELRRLFQERVITSETLVADNSGTDWQPYSEAAKKLLPPVPIKEKEIVVGTVDRAASGIGGCLGISVGVFGLVVGIGLCCTGIGAILGIPMIIGAFTAMGIGGKGLERMGSKNKSVLKGACPYCGHPQEIKKGTLGVNCPACLKRFVIQGGVFKKVVN